MSLIPWRGKRHENGGSSLAPLDAFRNEMDRVFDSFFHDPFALMQSGFGQTGEWNPTLDISESEDQVTVRRDPGCEARGARCDRDRRHAGVVGREEGIE